MTAVGLPVSLNCFQYMPHRGKRMENQGQLKIVINNFPRMLTLSSKIDKGGRRSGLKRIGPSSSGIRSSPREVADAFDF